MATGSPKCPRSRECHTLMIPRELSFCNCERLSNANRNHNQRLVGGVALLAADLLALEPPPRIA